MPAATENSPAGAAPTSTGTAAVAEIGASSPDGAAAADVSAAVRPTAQPLDAQTNLALVDTTTASPLDGLQAPVVGDPTGALPAPVTGLLDTVAAPVQPALSQNALSPVIGPVQSALSPVLTPAGAVVQNALTPVIGPAQSAVAPGLAPAGALVRNVLAPTGTALPDGLGPALLVPPPTELSALVGAGLAPLSAVTAPTAGPVAGPTAGGPTPPAITGSASGPAGGPGLAAGSRAGVGAPHGFSFAEQAPPSLPGPFAPGPTAPPTPAAGDGWNTTVTVQLPPLGLLHTGLAFLLFGRAQPAATSLLHGTRLPYLVEQPG